MMNGRFMLNNTAFLFIRIIKIKKTIYYIKVKYSRNINFIFIIHRIFFFKLYLKYIFIYIYFLTLNSILQI